MKVKFKIPYIQTAARIIVKQSGATYNPTEDTWEIDTTFDKVDSRIVRYLGVVESGSFLYINPFEAIAVAEQQEEKTFNTGLGFYANESERGRVNRLGFDAIE